jgi:hypothetical protein
VTFTLYILMSNDTATKQQHRKITNA